MYHFKSNCLTVFMVQKARHDGARLGLLSWFRRLKSRSQQAGPPSVLEVLGNDPLASLFKLVAEFSSLRLWDWCLHFPAGSELKATLSFSSLLGLCTHGPLRQNRNSTEISFLLAPYIPQSPLSAAQLHAQRQRKKISAFHG